MDPRLHFVTLASRDLDGARRFYSDGFRWEPQLDVPDEIIFYPVGPGLLLGLFEADKFAQDAAGAQPAEPGGVTLSYNVPSEIGVQPLVDRLVAAGGLVVKPVQASAFGGIVHAMVRDPNGVVWEIGYNPLWSIREDGSVELTPPS